MSTNATTEGTCECGLSVPMTKRMTHEQHMQFHRPPTCGECGEPIYWSTRTRQWLHVYGPTNQEGK